MRFIIDAQLPPFLARLLTARGHEADHVGYLQMAGAADAVIWDYAVRTDSIIITKDEDFAQRKAMTGAGPTLIWIRLPNTRRRELLAWFDAVMPNVLSALKRGETLID